VLFVLLLLTELLAMPPSPRAAAAERRAAIAALAGMSEEEFLAVEQQHASEDLRYVGSSDDDDTAPDSGVGGGAAARRDATAEGAARRTHELELSQTMNYAMLLMNDDQYDAAIEQFELAVQNPVANAGVWAAYATGLVAGIALGVCDASSAADVLRACTRSIELDPADSAEAYSSRGDAHILAADGACAAGAAAREAAQRDWATALRMLQAELEDLSSAGPGGAAGARWEEDRAMCRRNIDGVVLRLQNLEAVPPTTAGEGAGAAELAGAREATWRLLAGVVKIAKGAERMPGAGGAGGGKRGAKGGGGVGGMVTGALGLGSIVDSETDTIVTWVLWFLLGIGFCVGVTYFDLDQYVQAASDAVAERLQSF